MLLPAAAVVVYGYIEGLPANPAATELTLIGLYAGPIICYPLYALVSGSLWGGTPGGQMAGVRVLRIDGRPCEAWRLAARETVKGVSVVLAAATLVMVAETVRLSKQDAEWIFPPVFGLILYVLFAAPLLLAAAAPLLAGRTAHGCITGTILVPKEAWAGVTPTDNRREGMVTRLWYGLFKGLLLGVPLLNILAFLNLPEFLWVFYLTALSAYFVCLVACAQHKGYLFLK